MGRLRKEDIEKRLRVEADHAVITLTRGFKTIIDLQDVEKVQSKGWSLLVAGGKHYAYARVGGRSTPLHRFIMDAPTGFHVDHRDGDGLNNRRSNLRICTPQENARNARGMEYGESFFKGVVRVPGHVAPWRAYIKLDGKLLNLGYWNEEQAAARAYDAAARFYFGEFAKTNFEGTEALSREEVLALKKQTQPRNSPPAKGVYYHQRDKRWQAKVYVGGRRYEHLGMFGSEEEAQQALDRYKEAFG